jgi:hypothetical protein
MPCHIKNKKMEDIWNTTKSSMSGDFSDEKSLYEAIQKKFRDSVRIMTEDNGNPVQSVGFKSLDEEEIYNTIRHVIDESKCLKTELSEDDRYSIYDSLFGNYNKHIGKNDFGSIVEYLQNTLIPNAKMTKDDGSDLVYTLDENFYGGDYITFGGMGGYGFGGVGGFSGGGALDANGFGGGRRRPGFGGHRQGGQMTKRATFNPNGIDPDSDGTEPIKVSVSPSKSNYRPWEVELTPDGQRVNDIKRGAVKNAVDEMDSGIFRYILNAIEDRGVDLEELAQKTPEEIEDTLVRVIKQVAKEQEEETLNESLKKSSTLKEKIDTIFAFDMLSEEERKKSTKVRDAREILADKHNFKKANLRDAEHKFVMDYRDIEKKMKDYGYDYDDNEKSWIRKSLDKKEATPSDIPAPKTIDSPDHKPLDPIEHTKPKNGKSVLFDKVKNILAKLEVDTDISDDAPNDEIKKVLLATTDIFKENQGRFVLFLLTNNDKVNKKDQDGNDVISRKMVFFNLKQLGQVWNDTAGVWISSSDNKVGDKIKASGESVKSLNARMLLDILDDDDAFALDNNTPKISADEAIKRVEESGYLWFPEMYSWEHVKSDGDEVINESLDVLEEQRKKSPYAVEPRLQKKLQAMFLYRAIQIDALKSAKTPEEKKQIEEIIKTKNPTILKDSENAYGIDIVTVYDLLEGETKPVVKTPEKLDKKDIMKEEEQKDPTPQTPDAPSETPSDDTLDIQGDEDVGEEDSIEIQADKDSVDGISLSEDGNIIPDAKYKWNKKLLMWTEGNNIPKVLKDLGETQETLTARPVLFSESMGRKQNDGIKFIQFGPKNTPIYPAKHVLNEMKESDKYKWHPNFAWISKDYEDSDSDELNDEEMKAYLRDQRILKKYNNGDAFSPEFMTREQKDVLLNAVMAREIINAGIPLKEWYNIPEDPTEQKRAALNRKDIINRFKRKNSIQIVRRTSDTIPDAMKGKSKNQVDISDINRNTHMVQIKPRLLSKHTLAKLSKAGTNILAYALKKGGSSILQGINLLAMAGGHQGNLVKDLGKTVDTLKNAFSLKK